jgi:hypothetical protein
MANSREALIKLLESVQKSKSPGVEATVKDILDQIKEMEKRLENIEDEVVDEKDTKAKALKRAIKDDLEETIDRLRIRLDARSDTLKLSIASSFLDLHEGIKDSAKKWGSEFKKSFFGLGKQFVKNLSQTQRYINASLDTAAQTILKGVRTITSASSKVIMTSLNFSFNALMYFSKTTFQFIKLSFSKLTSVVSGIYSAIRSIPGKLKSFFTGLRDDLVGTLVNTIVGAVKFAFRVVAFLIKTTWAILKVAFKFVVTVIWTVGKYIFKAISWVITTALKALWTAISFAFKVVWKVVTRVFSFLVSVVWSALKTVVGFVLDVLLATLKLVAMTVLKTALFVGKVLVKTIANVMMAMFGPWLGLIVIIGVAVFLIFKGFQVLWKNITDTGSKLWSVAATVFEEAVNGFWGFLKRLLGIDDKTTFLGWIENSIGKILNVLKTYILDPIWNMISTIWDKLFKLLMGNDIIKAVVTWFTDNKVADAIRKAVFGRSKSDIEAEKKDLFQKRLETLKKTGYDTSTIKTENDLTAATDMQASGISYFVKSSEAGVANLRSDVSSAEAAVKIAQEERARISKEGQDLRQKIVEGAGGGWNGQVATLNSPELVALWYQWQASQEKIKNQEKILEQAKENLEAGLASDPNYEKNKQILAEIKANQAAQAALDADMSQLAGKGEDARLGGIWNDLREGLLKMMGMPPELSLFEAFSFYLVGNLKWDFSKLGTGTGILDQALRWINKTIVGDGGSWKTPAEGSPLAGLYNFMFGEGSWWNWETHNGFIGEIRFFILDKVAFPIMDFLSAKVVPVISKVAIIVAEGLEKLGFKGAAKMMAAGVGSVVAGIDDTTMGVMGATNQMRQERDQKDVERYESLSKQLLDPALKAAGREREAEQVQKEADALGIRINARKAAKKKPAEIGQMSLGTAKRITLGDYIDGLYGHLGLLALWQNDWMGALKTQFANKAFIKWSAKGIKLPESGALAKEFSHQNVSYKQELRTLFDIMPGLNTTHAQKMKEAQEQGLLQPQDIESLNNLVQFINDHWWNENGPGARFNKFESDPYKRVKGVDAFLSPLSESYRTWEAAAGIRWMINRTEDLDDKTRERAGLELGGIVQTNEGNHWFRIGESGSNEAVIPLNNQGMSFLIDWIKGVSDTVNPITVAAGGGPEKPQERESVQTRRQGLGQIAASFDPTNDKFEMTKYISMGLIGK